MFDAIGSFHAEGGVIMYPLYAAALATVGYAVAATVRLRADHVVAEAGNAGTGHARAGRAPDPRLEATVDGVLFWSVFAVVLGVLGTLIGIVHAARAIELAGSVHAGLVWGGVRVSLTSTIFALLLFCVAAPTWFFLRKAVGRTPYVSSASP